MNNEGLEYEIQELGAGGDNMLLTFFFFFFFVLLHSYCQAGRSQPVADVH